MAWRDGILSHVRSRSYKGAEDWIADLNQEADMALACRHSLRGEKRHLANRFHDSADHLIGWIYRQDVPMNSDEDFDLATAHIGACLRRAK